MVQVKSSAKDLAVRLLEGTVDLLGLMERV